MNPRPPGTLSRPGALTLSYRPEDVSAKEGQAADVPAKRLLSGGAKPQCHERTVPGLVGLSHSYELDATSFEPLGDERQIELISCGKHDDIGAFGVPAVDAFSNRVAYLSGLQPFGEVRSHHDEVRQGIGFRMAMAMASSALILIISDGPSSRFSDFSSGFRSSQRLRLHEPRGLPSHVSIPRSRCSPTSRTRQACGRCSD